jgi:imidazole glycerol-phosphate synthase subunit HisH
MKIAIIDYGMGNISSVANALSRLDCNAQITNDINEIKMADGLILPGVGAFGKAVENLKSLNLFEFLKEIVIKEKKPILGICLGMQLLADFSHERGKYEGLGLIPGEVKKINTYGKNLLLPHVGWNSVDIKAKSPLYDEIENKSSFYFVHTYYYECDEKYIFGKASYGSLITASIQKDNIFGVQFHPEKSQTNGLILLDNFRSEIHKTQNG